MGLNQFTDMTNEEFKIFVHQGGYVHNENRPKNTTLAPKVASCSSIDWVDQGAVTPVKNQGQCGSCWSFSTTGSLEGRCKIANGQLTSLSEEALVDCDNGILKNHGCNGGSMDTALSWVASQGGLPSESDYPYRA